MITTLTKTRTNMRKVFLIAMSFAAMAATGQPRQQQMEDSRGLKEAYADYFMVGVAVNQRNVTDEAQQALVK